MTFSRRVVAVAALVVSACGSPVTNVKLDTPAPPTSAATDAQVTATPATPNPDATATPARPPASVLPNPTATAGPTATATAIETPEGPPSWRELTPTGTTPGAREDHTWTVDGDGRAAYLFGGRTADGPSNELWSFDLDASSWTLLEPTGTAPTARLGHTATWVPEVGLVIWSGQGSDGFFADVNVYNPGTNTWTELPSLGAAPDARYGSCASLGPDGELWISHGFTGSGRFSDTRSYDFATGTWTDRTPVGEVPIQRCLHECFWSNNRLILYGGQTNGVAALGDIWAYDVASGTWAQGPEQQVPARQLYALADDGDTAIVFGGGAIDGKYLGDTLRLDAATLELSRIDRAGGPPIRSGATLILDPVRARALLFGGKDSDGVLGDTWELFTSP
ncbi:MAG: kelch repeat-containing protein [Candidatus Limnocylindrales bacterium]